MFIHKVMHFDAPSNGTLSQEEHVTALERELYALHCPAKVFDGIKIPCAKAYQLAPPPATNDNAAPAQTTSTTKPPEHPVTKQHSHGQSLSISLFQYPFLLSAPHQLKL